MKVEGLYYINTTKITKSRIISKRFKHYILTVTSVKYFNRNLLKRNSDITVASDLIALCTNMYSIIQEPKCRLHFTKIVCTEGNNSDKGGLDDPVGKNVE